MQLYAVLAPMAGVAVATQSLILIAQHAISGDVGLLTTALNYGGVGLSLVFCFYLLREQAKENKEQLKSVTQSFMDSLNREREVANSMNLKICERVEVDHKRCHADHDGLCALIQSIKEAIERIEHAKKS